MSNEDIYTTIAKNIRKYRREKRITIRELSRRTGYSYAFLRRIESKNGLKHFSIQAVNVISQSLEIEIKCLFEHNNI